MADPKTKPARRVPGKSKFRLPERPPRVADANPLRELLAEARTQEKEERQEKEQLARPAQRLAPPANSIAGVSDSIQTTGPERTQANSPAAANTADAAIFTPGATKSAGVSAGELTPGSMATVATVQEFEAFTRRWGRLLRPGQMSVCRVLFSMSYAQGAADCFTSMPKLAAAAGLKERQCYNVVSQLEHLGFLERPDTFNTPTKKGTVFRLYLSPVDRPAQTARRYHIGGDEIA